MSGTARRSARLKAATALATCAAVTVLAACGTGGPEVGAARAVVGSDDTTAVTPSAATPAPDDLTPTQAPDASPSASPGTPGSTPAARPTAARSAGPAPSGSPAPTGGAAAGSRATRGTAIPKGAVVVGRGSAASCTASALRSAVARVVRRGSGTVSFDCGAKPVRIALDRPLAFPGRATSRYVLDGRRLVTLDGHRVTGLVTLPAVSGLSATFRGLTFVNARTATQGAAIHGGWRNRLLVEDCTFLSNTSTSANGDFDGGGAIYVHEGTATVRRSTFRGNTALNGGAIQNTIGDLVVESSSFSRNRSTVAGRGGGGGAIYSDSGRLVVRRSTIKDNTAVRAGGGLFIWNAKNKTSRIENSTITGNRMTGSGDNGYGAGIRNGSGPLVVTGSTISRNVTYSQGGGLYNADDAAVRITRTRFTSNKAGAGGALFRVSGSITTTSCTFKGNTPADVR